MNGGMETLAHRLHWLRLQRGWTLAQVAQSSGFTMSFLSDMGRGRTLPSLPTLERIAAVYGLSLGECLVNVTVLAQEG